MSLKIEQTLTQKQILSQKMLQSVQILQMNTLELSDYLKELSLENPLMDIADAPEASDEHERIKKLEWLAGLDEQNRVYYKEDYEDEDRDEISGFGTSTAETLADHLLSQLIGLQYTSEQMRAFEYIALSLDDRGYYTGSIEEIVSFCGIAEKEAEKALAIMRRLDPIGVCAKDLKSCLLYQLDRFDLGDETERSIVSDYLDLLAKGQLGSIAKKLHVPLQRVKSAAEIIRSLRPKPASGFADRQVLKYIRPDVTVVKLKDYFDIFVNDSDYPSIHVNKTYINMLNDKNTPRDARDYILHKYKQLEQVQSAIEKRKQTISSLTSLLVERQSAFFAGGKTDTLTLYRMKDAAEALEVHESTISRAVRDKYLQCCWGIFPLGFFFPKGYHAGIASEDTSTAHIKEMLKEIISSEDKLKPLSDEKIRARLKENGADISRRTVAKYRESMNIPDCRARKESAE